MSSIDKNGNLNGQERFAVFSYYQEESIRQNIDLNGGWNYTTKADRLLYGFIHFQLQLIADICVSKYGLHLDDFGVHQILYTMNKKEKILELVIIDTEEYYFSEVKDGFYLPPIILFL
ncbi:MAG: hypothetical protein Q9M91_07275 [Candidatus Dojkabacteria bacterium]|nr:hypothetical protein [Candidatus Dojkabacteria bacterium]MDQ7021589.1 hypothetical protein [Candidatus Dojkabacteria bacterium]